MIRVVAILAWAEPLLQFGVSAWWSSAFVAAVARSAWAPISKPSSAEYCLTSLQIMAALC
jgi:hypothetical protein